LLETNTLIEGTEAMRVRILTLGLALVIGCGSLGCKSAPKMPWGKTVDKSAAAPTTAVAGAPQLPSEIAKQTEALANADPVKITTPMVKAPVVKNSVATATPTSVGGAAPAYSAASTAPSSYPSTGAQSFVPPTSTAASSPKAAPTSAVIGSMAASKALPYDPTKVPPAATSSVAAPSAAMAAAPAQADRYGMAAQDRYAANTYPTTTTPAYAPASYPTTAAPSTTPTTNTVASTPASASVPFAANPGSPSAGDRYATQMTPAASPVGTTLPNNSPPVQPASAVASVQPYRPGGTTSYPGTSANYEVATRPGTTSTTPSNYPAQSGVQYR